MPEVLEPPKPGLQDLIPAQTIRNPAADKGDDASQDSLAADTGAGLHGPEGDATIPDCDVTYSGDGKLQSNSVKSQIGLCAIENTQPGMIGWAEIADLYRNHGSELFRFAYTTTGNFHDAQDVLFDTMAGLFGKTLDNPELLKSYTCSTIVNRARSLFRHGKVVQKNTPYENPIAESAESAAITNTEYRTVSLAVMQLRGRQREVVFLRYYLGLKESEIAAALDISQGAVKSHSARAIDHLRSRLESDFKL